MKKREDFKNLYIKDYDLRLKECFKMAVDELESELHNNDKGFRMFKQLFKRNRTPHPTSLLDKLEEKIKENSLKHIGDYVLMVRTDELILRIPEVCDIIIAKLKIIVSERGFNYELETKFYDTSSTETILDSIVRREQNALEIHRDILVETIKDAEAELDKSKINLNDAKNNLAKFDKLYFVEEAECVSCDNDCITDVSYYDPNEDEISEEK